MQFHQNTLWQLKQFDANVPELRRMWAEFVASAAGMAKKETFFAAVTVQEEQPDKLVVHYQGITLEVRCLLGLDATKGLFNGRVLCFLRSPLLPGQEPELLDQFAFDPYGATDIGNGPINMSWGLPLVVAECLRLTLAKAAEPMTAASDSP